MEKIGSLFLPDLTLNPQHLWVIEGKGKATRQFDGISYAIIDGQPYRHLVTKLPPPGFISCCLYERQWWGWEPVPPDDAVFWECWVDSYDSRNFDWTYELCGPGITGNKEHSPIPVLVPHGRLLIPELHNPTLELIRSYCISNQIEGVVWWEDLWDLDCRKVKVQQSDFNFIRGRLGHDRPARNEHAE